MGPESLGSLITWRAACAAAANSCGWPELPSHLSRVLRTGQLHNYFMTTTMVSDALYRTAKAEQRLLASFTPAWGLGRQERHVDVRMELLQDVCRRIIAAEETEDRPWYRLPSLAPAGNASSGSWRTQLL
jgi:hypothetical protein